MRRRILKQTIILFLVIATLLSDVQPVLASTKYNSTWDTFSSNYYYNQLNARERKLWDAFDAQSLQLLTSKKNIKVDKTSMNDRSCYRLKEISIKGLSLEKAKNIILLFINSNPQYYFLNGVYLIFTGEKDSYISLCIYKEFANGAKRYKATKTILTKVNTLLKKVNKKASKAIQVKQIHDIVLKSATYDQAFETQTDYLAFEEKHFSQSIYSALIKKKTVCTGYSKLFEMLCAKCNIEVIYIESAEHMWNGVCVGDQWYYVDCTFDDNLMEGYNLKSCYNYLLKSINTFSEMVNNSTDMDESIHIPSSYLKKYLPKFTHDSDCALNYFGDVPSVKQQLSKPEVISTTVGDKLCITINNDEGTSVYYTLNGEIPSANTRCFKYTDTFYTNANKTVKIVAIKNNYLNSDIVTLKAS